MKRLTIAAAMLALILSAGIYDHHRTHEIFSRFESLVEAVDFAVDSGDAKTALARTDEMLAWWEKQKVYIDTFTYSPDTRTVSVTIGEIKGSLQADDFQNAKSKTQSLLILIKNVQSTVDFDFKDIF